VVAPVPVEHDPEEHIQPGHDLEREPLETSGHAGLHIIHICNYVLFVPYFIHVRFASTYCITIDQYTVPILLCIHFIELHSYYTSVAAAVTDVIPTLKMSPEETNQ